MRKRRREAAIASPESARLRIMLGAVSKLRQPHCYEKSNARSCGDLAALLELRCETKH